MFLWKYFLLENLMYIFRWMKIVFHNRSLKALGCQTSSSGIFPLATLIISYHNCCIFKMQYWSSSYSTYMYTRGCMQIHHKNLWMDKQSLNGQTIIGTMMKNTVLLHNLNLSPKKTFKYQRWGSHKLAPNAGTFLSMNTICLLQQQDDHFRNYHVISNTFEKIYLTV
jgi:hypothetical protein